MNLSNTQISFRKRIVFILFFFSLQFTSVAQIVDGNGYLIGDFVEIAIDGSGGHEGTADLDGSNSRGGSDEVPFGFVADPLETGWDDYNGDFFTPGTPENGFGLQINGVNYSNNAWNSIDFVPYLKEIPTAPGGDLTYTTDSLCHTLEWTGLVAGVLINVKYRLNITDQFYVTEITLTNNTSSTLTDLYYYRNVDPDNNQAIGGAFATTNEITSQPDSSCNKAEVSATQSSPEMSYIGLVGLDDKLRVSHGGFSNRNAADIWNGLGGLNTTPGDINTDDEAISIAYKTNLAPGESAEFSYSVVLSSAAINQAISGLYSINFGSLLNSGGESLCQSSIINSCIGDSIRLNIEGPDVDLFTWLWEPSGETNDTIVVYPDDDMLVTVTGTPIIGCPSILINRGINILNNQGPRIGITDQGPICNEISLDSLLISITDSTLSTNCFFLTEIPDSATQTGPEFENSLITATDEVYLFCGDTATGCYGWLPINIEFFNDNSAGNDTIAMLCSGPGLSLDLHDFLSDSAVTTGLFDEITGTILIDDTLGIFFASGMIGTYTFSYIVHAPPPCLNDTSFITIEIVPGPSARFEFEIDGEPFSGGLSTCIISEIDFINTSTIIEPGIIVSYEWDFGDGTTSTLENPSHTYSSIGSYVVDLVVTSDNGCVHAFTRPVNIYLNPMIEPIYLEPTCFGSEDGSITTLIDIVGGEFDIEITDESGTILNTDSSATVDMLGAGTYTITIEDVSGCGATTEVILSEPEELFIYLRPINPPCLGDSGYAVVDSVSGENPNNPISYIWDPNPAGIEGIAADSSYWMVAGDYSVTAIDSKGCMARVEFTLVDSPPFFFVECGSDSAYCRLYDYQSGNGIVYAAVSGGLLNYQYEWTYLVDGSTSNTSTWGGRNPGEHEIKVTDGGGCVITKSVFVDSINPVASFTTSSLFLNDSCQVTAPVEVEFANTSMYYTNPNDPDPDTLFLWNLANSYDGEGWLISHDIDEKFDTIYEARGESYHVDACLIAFNKNGCSDTACKRITIFEPPELTPPNIFTPNNHQGNDVFTFDYYAKGIRDFTCIIVNRWGVQVAEINSIAGFWDGNDFDGDPCTDGVYFYTYVAVADNEEEFSGQGNITLIRRTTD